MTEETKEHEARFRDDSDSEDAAEGSAAGGSAAGGQKAPTGGLGSKTSPVTPVEVTQEFIDNLNVGRGATEPYDPAVLIAMVTYFVGNLVLIGNVTPETRDARWPVEKAAASVAVGSASHTSHSPCARPCCCAGVG